MVDIDFKNKRKRLRECIRTLIDLILSNRESIKPDVIETPRITNHCIIVVDLVLKTVSTYFFVERTTKSKCYRTGCEGTEDLEFPYKPRAC